MSTHFGNGEREQFDRHGISLEFLSWCHLLESPSLQHLVNKGQERLEKLANPSPRSLTPPVPRVKLVSPLAKDPPAEDQDYDMVDVGSEVEESPPPKKSYLRERLV